MIMSSSRFLELRFMLSSMLNCMPFLMWGFFLIFLLIGYCALLFLTLCSHWLNYGHAAEHEEHAEIVEALSLYFAGFGRTLITLFMAVTGGFDWREMWEPLAKISVYHE